MTMAVDAIRESLNERLGTLRAGDVSVQAVEVTDGYGIQDGPSIDVVILLSDPTGETWGLDETAEIRAKAFDAFSELGILTNVRFRFAGGASLDETEPDEEGVPDE